MHKLLLILPVVFNIAFAATITIENQNLECNRTQDKREAYLCKKDNQEIFVTNGGYGYSGYLKDSSGKFEVKTPKGVHAKGTTKAKAEAQKRLLNAIDHGFKPTHKDGQNAIQERANKLKK